MPNTIQKLPYFDSEVTEQTRHNIEDITQKFSSIFSRDNLGLNNKTVTSDTILTNEDSLVVCDTSSGNITITLPPANSWGSNKTPIITIIKTSFSNTLTIQPSGSDTLNYITNGFPILGNITAKGASVLFTNGSNAWWSIKNELDIEFPYVRTIAGATTLNLLDKIVICGNSGANYNVTLPLANSSGGYGQVIQIHRNNTGAGIVATVIAQGTDTLIVDGRVTAALALGYGCTVVSNGSNTWYLH